MAIPRDLIDRLAEIRRQKNVWRRKEANLLAYIQNFCPHENIVKVRTTTATPIHPSLVDFKTTFRTHTKCKDCGKVFK